MCNDEIQLKRNHKKRWNTWNRFHLYIKNINKNLLNFYLKSYEIDFLMILISLCFDF